MNVNYIFSLIAVVVLFLLAYAGVEAAGLRFFFGVFIPYLALLIFVAGFIYRIIDWARSPVPYRIPTTCGQQKTIPGFKESHLDNPFTTAGVIGRMFLEIVTFRSLFRNTKAKMHNDRKLIFFWEKWLWLFALLFHYAFLVVFLRHLRFFSEPVPFFITYLEKIDGFFQISVVLENVIRVSLPIIYLSGFGLLVGVTFLLLRRIFIPQVKYISTAADYFPLFLIIGITISGIMMRYFTKVDVVGIKDFTMSLLTFSPRIPENVGGIFFVHLLFVSVLFAYFPFSKLMHLGGIFMSPTRNLTADTRMNMHVNPVNYPVEVHSYEEYEDEFRDKMIEAGLPVEKQPEEQSTVEKE